MSEKKSTLGVVWFAFCLSVVCSLLITVAASGLKGFQDENIILDKKINILKAANLVDPDHRPEKDVINELYKNHIRDVKVDQSGRILETDSPPANAMNLYFYRTGDAIDGYILPINTRGLWGRIKGYLAFENDGQTVSGFSVFSHSETPGLGGEIESQWFQENFKGKKILNSQGNFVSVGIAKGQVKNMPQKLRDHYVDGISGATLTGRYLSEGIKATLERYEPLSVTFRQKQLRTIETE